MNDILWRFPGNGYTADTGLDTADMETFKKDVMASLAREICQNSIDAKQPSNDLPVKVHFKSFSVKNNQIPQIEEIKKQLNNCLETWDNNNKIKLQLIDMLKESNKEDIYCLRISDFNTTGLLGVQSDADNTPWHDLVHGSGISNKGTTSGGSKGIGKFATFVASGFNTVFYSTNTLNNEIGYEGICKLCSAKQPNTDEKTQGIGYYGFSKMNKAIPEQLNIDPTFKRDLNNYGTDIYIIGFKNKKNWKKDIISKILDSFISAIVFKSLEVEVDDIKLNSETLKEVIHNDQLINKANQKSIISQFKMLTAKENRFEDKIFVENIGEATLYTLAYDDVNSNLATNSCVMIRYPYMKIKEINKISTIPCSVMCVIGDNKLNEILRNIENPQHTDWEFKRIDDLYERKEVKNIYNDLLDQIKKCVINHLMNSDDIKTDIEGADEYLPGKTSINSSIFKPKPTQKITDTPKINKKKIKHKNVNINASIYDANGDGIMLDIGKIDDNGEVILTPQGQNTSSGNNFYGGNNLSKGVSSDDGSVIVKPAELRGMKYRFFCIDKIKQKYAISFISDFTEEKVSLELYSVDESGQKYPVKLSNCTINKESVPLKDDKLFFSIEHGKRILLEMDTDQEELFSGEVKVYAYR